MIPPWHPDHPRCICGARRDEPCRSHADVSGYMVEWNSAGEVIDVRYMPSANELAAREGAE